MIEPPTVKSARPENELFTFQLYPGKTYNRPPAYQTEEKAVHGIQLYILSSFIIQPYILSFVVEQLDRSVMHLCL